MEQPSPFAIASITFSDGLRCPRSKLLRYVTWIRERAASLSCEYPCSVRNARTRRPNRREMTPA